MMTKQEYVDNEGLCCPVCRSTNLSGVDSPQIDAGIAWMSTICMDCDHDWVDEYDLTGIRSVTDADGREVTLS